MAFDASSVGSGQAVSTLSVSHTCTGANLKLAVGIGQRVDAQAVSSIDYNGTAMSVVGTRVTNGIIDLDLYQLSNPTTGANNINVTMAGACTVLVVGGQSFTGRDTVAATDAQGGSAGSGTSGSTIITTVADLCDVVDFLCRRNDNEANAGAGQTVPVSFPHFPTTSTTFSGSYVAGKSPAGAETMDWSWTTSHSWTHKTCSFAPAPPSGATNPGWLSSRGGWW